MVRTLESKHIFWYMKNRFKMLNNIFTIWFLSSSLYQILKVGGRGKWVTDWNTGQAVWVLLQAFLMKWCVPWVKFWGFFPHYQYPFASRSFYGKINLKSPVNINLQHCWNGTVTFTAFLNHPNIYKWNIFFLKLISIKKESLLKK